jgi:hypothetical protein
MKTLEQILQYKSETLDGRDLSRLASFIPVEHYESLGLKLKEGTDPTTIVTEELTQENVLSHLRADLEFAFEKALKRRGISASLMYDVVKMWMWVMDDSLGGESETDYAQYGLPFLKSAAVKYNLPNEIGDDRGDEFKYSSEGEDAHCR